MKPITYWVETDQIHWLCEKFGYQLEGLSKREKRTLRTVLSMWTALRDVAEVPLTSGYIAAENGWIGYGLSDTGMCSEDVMTAISLLEGITVTQADELIRAITAQIVGV